MELSLSLLEQISAMVIVAILGMVFIRGHMLQEADSRILAKVVLYGTNPCMLFSSFQMEFSGDKAQGFLIGLIAAAVIHLVFIAMEKLIQKPLRLDAVERTSLVFTNAGYILIPLVHATLGSEYVFYYCPFIVIQTFLIWTYLLVDMGQKNMVKVRKVLLNPNILAIILGLVTFFGQIKIPHVLDSSITLLGDATGALTMLIIGMAIGMMPLKRIFSQGRAYLVASLRLLVFPGIIIAIIWASHICVFFPVAEKVLLNSVMAAAAPVGTIVTQFSELFGLDGHKAGSINILSVFFCIITIPMLVFVYQLVNS